MRPIDRVRQAIEAFHEDRFRYLSSTSDAALQLGGASITKAGRVLLEKSFLELVEEASQEGLLSPQAQEACRRHHLCAAEFVRRERIVAEVSADFSAAEFEDEGDRFSGIQIWGRLALVAEKNQRRLMESVLQWTAERASALDEKFEQRREHAPVWSTYLPEPDVNRCKALLDGFLSDTDDLADEVVAYLAPEPPTSLGLWTAPLRRGRPSGRLGRGGRTAADLRATARGIASSFGALGMESTLRRSGSLFFARYAFPHFRTAVDARGKVGIWAGVAGGPVGDLQLVRALGCAMAHGATHPSLPPELRYFSHAGFPELVGGLLSGWLSDPRFRQALGHSRAEAEHGARTAGALLLLELRLRASIAMAASGRDAVATATSRALRVEVPRGAATPFLFFESSPQAIAHLASLAAHLRFRETFDEDWFKNPKAASALAAMSQPGDRALFSEESGIVAALPSASEVRARAVELFPA